MGNRSTILELYEAVNGPIQTDPSKRYAESTQTLYKNKNLLFDNEENVKSNIKDIFVEPTIYQKIVRGEHPYLITKQKGFMIGDEVHIIELSTDRRTIYKRVLSIETEDPGLASGFIVLTLA